MATMRKVAIEGDFTIFAAQGLKEELLAALDSAERIDVDLSRVSEIDSAGIQLMVAAKKEAAARQKPLAFTGHSPAVLEALDLCDLSSHFGDPVLIPRASEE